MKQSTIFGCAAFKKLLFAALMLLLALSQLAAASAPVQGMEPAQTAPVDLSAASTVTVRVPMVDTQLYYSQPTTNGTEEPYVGDVICTETDCAADPLGRTLFKPVLSSLPPNITISSASFHLRLMGSYDYPGSIHSMSFYRATTLWHAGLSTWNNQPATGELVGVMNAQHAIQQWYSLDITTQVRNWQQGVYPNYGLVMTGPLEQDGSYRVFAGYDFVEDTSGVNSQPYVEITYIPTPPTLNVPSQSASWFTDGSIGVQPQSVVIQNTGSLPLDWSAAALPSAGWLGLSQSSGTLGPNLSYTISLSPALTGQPYGLKNTNLQITSTTPGVLGSPGSVSVTMNYIAPPIPMTYLPSVMVTNNNPPPPPPPPPAAKPRLVVVLVGVDKYRYMTDPASTNSAADFSAAPVSGYRAGIPGKNLIAPENDINTLGATFAALNDTDVEFCKNQVPSGVFSAPALNASCGGSAPVKIFTLLGAQATKEAIQQLLQQIAQMVDANTTLAFIFSGHGGPSPDHNEDEDDGRDEFIATYLTNIRYDDQNRPIDYTNIITDDELGAWLDEVPAGKTVVALDSCYSGGMLSLTGAPAGVPTWRSRGLPWLGDAAESAPQDLSSGFIQDLVKPGRVVLAASQEGQSSYEDDFLQQGLFSYYLAMALVDRAADTNHNGWVSAVEAFNYLKPKVQDYAYRLGVTQTPMLGGDTDGQIDLTKP